MQNHSLTGGCVLGQLRDTRKRQQLTSEVANNCEITGYTGVLRLRFQTTGRPRKVGLLEISRYTGPRPRWLAGRSQMGIPAHGFLTPGEIAADYRWCADDNRDHLRSQRRQHHA